MTVEIHSVQRVRVFQEATFGADSSGSLGSFTDVPIREGSAKLETHRDSFDPQQLVQHIDEYRNEVLGKRSAKLTFTLNLAPTGVAAAAMIAAVQGALGFFLKMCLGGEFLGTGTTFTGGTATVPIVTSAAGFVGGGGIGWVNASGVLEVREIKSISGLNITLAHAFSGSPTNAQVAYGVASYFPTANPANSLAFVVDGLEDDDHWLVTGAQLADGMTISVDPASGSIPSIAFSFAAARWYDGSETSTPLNPATIAVATYSNTSPIVGEAGDFRVFTVGSPTLLTTSAVHASAIAFSPSIKYVPYTSPDGVNTVKRWVRARSAPIISGGWTNPYEDLTWFSARNARGSYNPAYQIGTVAGSAVLISARTVQIVDPQRGPDAAGLLAQMVKWKGRRNTDTALTTDQATAPFSVHLA